MKLNFKLSLLILILITALGGFLRFYQNTTNPPNLTGDEIAFGYSAYSILKTGQDEHGKFLPLTLESVGDYKNPLPAYLMIPSIYLFGLNDFSVRFQNALIGTLTIPIFFFFLLDLFKKKGLSLLGALFLAISPWHIFYSRFAYEPLIASTFVLLGIWFFIKMQKGSIFYAALSAFFLILTMYTAFAPRFFIVVFTLLALATTFPKIKQNWQKTALFLTTCILLSLPLLYLSLFQGAGTRFSMVFIGNDINFSRYITLHSLFQPIDWLYLLFFWANRYLSYLHPHFIFVSGLGLTAPNTIGLGLLYFFEIPTLILGTIRFIKDKVPYKTIFVIWLLAGLIPDSLTNNQQHGGRLLQIAPVLILLTTLGTIQFFSWLTNFKSLFIKSAVLLGGCAVVVLTLIHAFLTFSIHFPKAKGESFDEGMRQAVEYVNRYGQNYEEIVFDPRHGIDGPYFITNPYLYILFYTKYDPDTFQKEPKVYGSADNPYFKFSKFTTRYVNWQTDRGQKGTLFIASPWSIPQSDLKEGELLETIYLSNGSPTYYIVSPK